MGKLKLFSLALLAVGLTAVSTIRICAESPTEKSAFTIRRLEPQVVLYTVYRGGYDRLGKATGNLYALAGKKRISPRGGACYVYLNNPRNVSSQHLLTEIRIPVDASALKLAGSLGEITDVKELPAMEVAVAIKPKGQADPASIYDNLYPWIIKQGYTIVDSACERFLTNADAGDYANMESEIMVPVKRASQ
jgi:effector-binding domain-containing protein